MIYSMIYILCFLGQKDIKGFSLASLSADDMAYIKGDE